VSFCDASSCSLVRPQTHVKSCGDQRRTRPAGVPLGCRGAQLATLHSCKYRRLHARGLSPPTGTTGRRRSWLIAPGRAAFARICKTFPNRRPRSASTGSQAGEPTAICRGWLRCAVIASCLSRRRPRGRRAQARRQGPSASASGLESLGITHSLASATLPRVSTPSPCSPTGPSRAPALVIL
jgi:hypothetical protein